MSASTSDPPQRPAPAAAAFERALPAVAGVFALAAAAYLAAAWAVGAEATWEAAARLGAPALLGGTAVASATYLVRWWRWRVLLLGGLGHRLPAPSCLRIYLAGLALGPTPGKLGETLRSAFLLPRGVKVRASLAAFFADRLSDVIAMATLGIAAAWWLGERQSPLEWLWGLVVAAAVVLGTAGRRVPMPTDGAGQDAPPRPGTPIPAPAAAAPSPRRGWRAQVQRLLTPLAAWARLWTWPRALGCVAAGLVAYAAQGLVFGAYAAAIGGDGLAPARGVLIFATATLLGAASGVPGGLGVMEAALVWQLQRAGVEPGAALAAALLFRLSTLWTAVLIGAFALAGLAHPVRGGER